MNRTAALRRNSRGFTVVELSICLSISAVLAGQAIPAMTKMRQEQSLRVAAETLASDLRFARSEAARMGDSVYFRVSGKGAQACYLLHTGARNDCDCASGRAVCTSQNAQVIKSEWLPSNRSLQLRSNAETLEFQRRQGLVTQTGSIDVSLNNGTGIREVVAITGRVRSCYTSAKLAGMPKCA